MGLEHIIRPSQSPNFGPPKTTQSLACEETPATVVLQFGKGGVGKIGTISYSFSVRSYMTKQQKEICEQT